MTDDGEVYSFGRGIQGELGHPERRNETIPRLVAGLKHQEIVGIACGSLTSYALTASGQVYQWSVAHISTSFHPPHTHLSTRGLIHKDTIDRSNGSGGVVVGVSGTSSVQDPPVAFETEEHMAVSGQLHGIAEDANTFMVPIDREARQQRGETVALPGESRQLRSSLIQDL